MAFTLFRRGSALINWAKRLPGRVFKRREGHLNRRALPGPRSSFARGLEAGEAFVIRNPVPARTRLDENEEAAPSLLVVDTETKDVLATYVPPRDEDGAVTGAVIDLAFTVVPE
jgi:hypothetical protein